MRSLIPVRALALAALAQDPPAPAPPEPPAVPKAAEDPVVIIQTSMGDIRVRLFRSEAPKTVQNFLELAEGTKEWKDAAQEIREERRARYANPTFPLEEGTHRYSPILFALGGLQLPTSRLPELPPGSLRPIALSRRRAWNRSTSSSVIGRACHWLLLFVNTCSASQPACTARSTALSKPPAIDICAPSRTMIHSSPITIAAG